MPVPSTPRRASARKTKTPPKKSVDVGSPLGPYDNNSVREKVRQWQAQGGGTITTPDPCPDDENETLSQTKAARTETFIRERQRNTGQDASESPAARYRSGRKKERTEEPQESKPRSVSAPRKRIISDGHWVKKKNTSPLKEKVVIDKSSIPSWALPDDGIRVRPIPELPPREPRKTEEQRPPKTPKQNDDGIRVYSTPRSSYMPPDKSLFQGEETEIQEEEGSKEPDAHDSDPVHFSPTVSLHSKEVTPEKSPISPQNSSGGKENAARKPRTGRKESGQQRSPKQPQRSFAAKRESKKTGRGNIFSNVIDGSKKIFAKSDPAPTTSPKVPRIESWLNATPDPFLDQDAAMYVETAAEPPATVLAGSVLDSVGDESEEEDEPPVEVPAPLKFPSKRRKRRSSGRVKGDETSTEDPNGIWESVSRRGSEAKKDSRHRRNEHRVSTNTDEPIREASEPTDIPQATPGSHSESSATVIPDLESSKPDLSPTNLRRRGARRDGSKSVSPKREKERSKSSPLKDSFTPVETTSKTLTDESLDQINRIDDGPSRPPPGTHSKRPFPFLGSRPLSTIASVESFNTGAEKKSVNDASSSFHSHKGHSRHAEKSYPKNRSGTANSDSHQQDHIHPSLLDRKGSKGQPIKDSDLQSILSLPKADSRTILSSRSFRSNRTKAEVATAEEILSEITSDEAQYMRELQTLVDGVIPVLLSSVLSKSNSAVAAGLFSPTRAAHTTSDLTKPICDMGVALERLKKAHKRIPLTSIEMVLTWAHGVASVYRDYLKAWRLGFQDVVVNLAPANDDGAVDSVPTDRGGLPQNEHGDVVGANGERVDVAYLLKRPLVRLKYLSKHLNSIRVAKPSAEADNLAEEFQGLVAEARKRSNEERARIEDEAAASVDATRARDPKTLGPLAGVSIDATRRVLARDIFDLTLLHSSGQRIDCKVELFFRTNAPDKEPGGDVLICEIGERERWLLFPPIQRTKMSARNGDDQGEIVVMVKGNQSDGQEWHELLSLRNDDEETGFEWVQMFGLEPVPPKLMRMASFISRAERRQTLSLPAPPPSVPSELSVQSTPTTPTKSRTPSPRELEVPIGEKAIGNVKRWIESPAQAEPLVPQITRQTPIAPKSPTPSRLSETTKEARELPSQESTAIQTLPSQKAGHPASPETPRTPKSLNEALELAGSPSSSLKRSKARRQSRYHAQKEAQSPTSQPKVESPKQSPEPSTKRHSQPTPKTLPSLPPSPVPPKKDNLRPTLHSRSSSTPTLDLPIIPKIRKDSLPPTPAPEPEEEPVWPVEDYSPTASKLSSKHSEIDDDDDKPPPPPPHRSPSPAQIGNVPVPDLTPVGLQRGHRRTSSPLKHEYEPSTATETDTESEASTVEHHEISETPESSEDDDLEADDIPGPLMPMATITRRNQVAPYSYYSPKAETIRPSSSGSQSRPEAVTRQAPPKNERSVVGSVFFWSNKGSWQPLHTNECNIVIRGGIIEAFDMLEYHSAPMTTSTDGTDSPGIDPLIGLEVTPIVPIRRGTAIDVTVRSNRATKNSKFVMGDNYMFRTRTQEECDMLYDYINWARLNNSVYMQLEQQWQNERISKFGGASFNGKAGGKKRMSWFGRKRSYRAASAPTPSIHHSERSSGTGLSAAMSIFQRLSAKKTGISIARSTITSRHGSRTNSIYTASDDTPSSGASTPGASASLGLNNMKITLHLRGNRASTSFSRRGTAFLTFMRPKAPTRVLAPGIVAGEAGEGADESGNGDLEEMGDLLHNRQQAPAQRTAGSIRMVIKDKKEQSLIDIILGKENFYPYAKRAVAFCVRQEEEFVPNTGGVDTGKWSWFLIETETEPQAAWILQLVRSTDFNKVDGMASFSPLSVVHEIT